MKYHFVLALVLVFYISGFSFVEGKNEGHGFSSTLECEDNVDLTTLQRRSLNVNAEGKFFRKVDAFVKLPQTGGVFPGKIVCLEVIDTSINGLGGYITRVSGGVGERNVKFHIISQFGRGIKFTVNAYYEVPDEAPVTPKK